MGKRDNDQPTRREFAVQCAAATWTSLLITSGLSAAEPAAVGPNPSGAPGAPAARLAPPPNLNAAAEVVELLKHVDPDVLYHPRTVLPENDAWPLWEEAASKYVDYLHGRLDRPLKIGVEALIDGEPLSSDEQLQAVREWLEQNADTLTLVRRGIARGDFMYPRAKDAVKLQFLIDDFGRLRNLGRVLQVQGTIAWHDKDWDLAFGAANDLLEMGRILTSAECLLVDYLVGLAIVAGGVNIITRIGMHAETPASTAAACLAALTSLKPTAVDAIEAHRVEFCRWFVPIVALVPNGVSARDMASNLFFQEFAEDHPPEPRVMEAAKQLLDDVAQTLRNHPQLLDKVATVELASDIMSERIRAIKLPYRERTDRRFEQLDAELKPLPECFDSQSLIFLDSSAKIPALTPEQISVAHKALLKVPNVIGKWIIHSCSATPVSASLAWDIARIESARLRIAIAIYHRRHNKLPIDLNALVVEGLLKTVPVDPFGDQPFHYDPQRRVLWSIGPNGNGNGDIAEEGFENFRLAWRVLPGRI